MQNKKIKNVDFIGFLNNEFGNKKIDRNVATVLPEKEIKIIYKEKKKSLGKRESKKFEDAFLKKTNVRNRLTNASKLIKTMEVFLESSDLAGNSTYAKSREWNKIYDEANVDIDNSVKSLTRRKRNTGTSNSFFMSLNRKLEYAPKGGVLNHSVIVISVFMLSFFLTVLFPNFVDKSISTIDSIFYYPLNGIVKIKDTPKQAEMISDRKVTERVTKEQLTEYVKKNSNKIKNNQNIPLEDITGLVAGVEE